MTKADSIGWVNGLYRLDSPPSGMDRDRIDEIWAFVEPDLPRAISRLQRRIQTAEDERVLVNYVAAAGVRHPTFGPALNRWLTDYGQAPISGDQLKLARVQSLAETLLFMRGLRWRVLHSPKHAHRFILNDRGWTYIGQEERDGRGLFVPLNGRLALLAWHAGIDAGGFDHHELRPTWIKWLNAATWTEAPQFVVGHPYDGPMLSRLRTADEVGPALDGTGPYRGSDRLLFDDPFK